MAFDEAARLVAYVRGQCWWLDVFEHCEDATDVWRISIHLPWPKGEVETVRTYSRRAVHAAMDRLNDASDHYWRTVPCNQS